MSLFSRVNSCIFCRASDFDNHIAGPRAFFCCTCCQDRGVHRICYEENVSDTFLDNQDWFCSHACEKVHTGLCKAMEENTGGFEIHRNLPGTRRTTTTIKKVLGLLRTTFDADDGGMLKMICSSYIDQQKDYDFGNFNIAVSNNSGQIASVAVFRCFGEKFAEVPFVATAPGKHGAGHCRYLMQCLENKLADIGVKWLLVQSMPAASAMWTGKFGFKHMTVAECLDVDDRIIMYDGVEVLKKCIVRG